MHTDSSISMPTNEFKVALEHTLQPLARRMSTSQLRQARAAFDLELQVRTGQAQGQNSTSGRRVARRASMFGTQQSRRKLKETLEVVVLMASGERIPIVLDAQASIFRVKRTIEDKKGIPKAHQILLLPDGDECDE